MYYAVMISPVAQPEQNDVREFSSHAEMMKFWNKCLDAGEATLTTLSELENKLGLKSRAIVNGFKVTQVVAQYWER